MRVVERAVTDTQAAYGLFTSMAASLYVREPPRSRRAQRELRRFAEDGSERECPSPELNQAPNTRRAHGTAGQPPSPL